MWVRNCPSQRLRTDSGVSPASPLVNTRLTVSDANMRMQICQDGKRGHLEEYVNLESHWDLRAFSYYSRSQALCPINKNMWSQQQEFICCVLPPAYGSTPRLNAPCHLTGESSSCSYMWKENSWERHFQVHLLIYVEKEILSCTVLHVGP